MPPPDRPGDHRPRGPGHSDVAAGSSLGDALEWLDRHVDLEAIERGAAGRAGEPSLARIAALLDAMGDPQANFGVLHVTGTNGKGSTSRLASALLQESGLFVGTYTSPHLESLNERIATDATPIDDDDLAGAIGSLAPLEELLLARGVLEVAPTWFELVTATAYRHFADVAVEAAVVEVGLGGRYDATNAADGAVAVVTNVELDHTDILGNTREAIAREKAGIVKTGSVVVCGEEDPALAAVFANEAERVGASGLWQRGRDFGCVANLVAHGGRLLDLRTPGASYDEVYLPLHGAHQGENAAVALAATEALFGAPLGRDVVEAAFASVTVPGRLEVLGRRPLVVLDGAHNEAGAAALGAAIAEDFAAAERLVVVIGCLRGRDTAALLAPLKAAAEALGAPHASGPLRVVACRPSSLRAQPAEAVAAAARGLGLETVVEEDVGAALERAVALAGERDLVLVTGSLYVVGAARTAWRRAHERPIRPR